MELSTGAGHVTRPADEFHDGVLVNGLPLAADRYEVPVPMRTEEQVIRIQEVHAVRSDSRPGGVNRIPARVDAAVQNNIGRLTAAVELDA
jgi:hypothetical protein